MIKRLFGVVVAACAAIALMIGVSSCSDSEVSPETSESGARLAPSVSDYAEQLADKFAGSMDDRQREAVERVVKTGEVSQSDYEQALSDYRQCMIDRGYREIIFLDMGGGIREEAAHQAGTDQQERRYAQDSMECGDAHTTVIDELYRMQAGNPELLQDHNEAIADCLRRQERRYAQDSMECGDAHTTVIDELYRMQAGNPELLQDHNEAIADCLRRTGQVESSYDDEQFRREYERYQNGTADSDEWPFSLQDHNEAIADCLRRTGQVESSYDDEQFRREYERYQNGTADSDEWPFSFPEDTSESQMCRVSNGWISVDQTDPVEELW